MNTHLYNALAELTKAGAQKLPRPETIEQARNGKTFSGKKADGTLWILKKNNEDSYNITC